MMKSNKILMLFVIAALLLGVFTSCTTTEYQQNESDIEKDDINNEDTSLETSITLETFPSLQIPSSDKETEKQTEKEAESETEPETEEPKETEKEPEVVDEGEVTYINGILIANKTYSLPKDYNPGVNAEANTALKKMINEAASDGIELWIKSGFRSYERQETLYNGYVARSGQAEADRYSARPGHSEHQTGLAFDLNSLEQSFGETAEGKWLKENCHKYGFIIRYPEDKESITGYMYEPWHVRYLGVDTATDVYESGLCLEEYLNITSVYSK